MKTVSNDVHTLVKSLTPSQKKKFRQQTEAQCKKGSKPLYLLLFDAIDEQPIYDEGKILKKLSGKITCTNISYQKNYLFEAILDFLTTKTGDFDPVSEWMLFIRKSQVLRQRNMFEHALRMAQKAYEFAQKSQLLFEALYTQNFIWQLQLRRWTAADHVKVDRQGKSLLQQLAYLIIDTKLTQIYYQLQYATSKVPLAMSHEEFQDFVVHILESNTLKKSWNDSMPFSLRYKTAVIYSAIYARLKRNEEALTWKQRELELLETQPESLLRANGEYLFALINFCHRCRFAGKFDLFLEYVKKLEKHDPPASLAAEKTFGLLREWSSYYFQTGDYKKAAAMEVEIAAAIRKFPEYNDRFTIETLYLNTAVSYFHFGKNNDALRNTAFITNSSNPGKTFTLHIAAKLLNCMIYFEQKETQLLEFQLNQLYRELLKFNHNDVRLQEVVSLFKKLNPNDQKDILQHHLQKFYERISRKDYDTFLIRWFNLRDWVQNQIALRTN